MARTVTVKLKIWKEGNAMKRKKHKIRMERICVSLPAVMLENYRNMAAETGLSVSRVILTVLRSKDRNVLLLPRLYTDYAKKVDRVIAAALAANDVTPELKETLESLRLSEEFARVVVHEKEGRQWDNKSLNVTVRRR